MEQRIALNKKTYSISSQCIWTENFGNRLETIFANFVHIMLIKHGFPQAA